MVYHYFFVSLCSLYLLFSKDVLYFTIRWSRLDVKIDREKSLFFRWFASSEIEALVKLTFCVTGDITH